MPDGQGARVHVFREIIWCVFARAHAVNRTNTVNYKVPGTLENVEAIARRLGKHFH